MQPDVSKRFVIAVALLTAVAVLIGVAIIAFALRVPSHDAETADSSDDSASCNVLGIKVRGEIVSTDADIPVTDSVQMQDGDGSTYLDSPNYSVASDLDDTLREERGDDSIKGLIVDVDSPGGGAEAGSEIASAIHAFGKPSVSFIREIGASSGYLSASAADHVIASPDSTVGSIGATESYVDQSKEDAQNGLTYNSLSSGPYKDMFDPDQPLSAAQRAIALRDINLSKEIFVNLVAQYRKQPKASIEALADGSTVMGQAALDDHLVDELGGEDEALSYIKKQIGEDPVICWQN